LAYLIASNIKDLNNEKKSFCRNDEICDIHLFVLEISIRLGIAFSEIYEFALL
jgi:hypothetical protein